MFSIKLYESTFTSFINGYLAKHPEVQEAREVYAETWWKKKEEVDFFALTQTLSKSE